MPKVHLSFALSITHLFSSAGADAGFAALVGLAILVLLYFAHARETSTLRNQLEAATQRIEQLERGLAGGAAPPLAAQQPVAAQRSSSASVAPPPVAPPSVAPPPVTPPPVSARPLSAAPVAPPVSARPVSALPVAAPAGVAAPPLSDATRVVPIVEPAGDREHSAGGRGDSGPGSGDRAALAGDGFSPASAPGSASPLVTPPPPPITGATPPPPIKGTTPSPVTAAAGGNGFSAAAAPGAPRSLLEHGLPREHGVPRWIIPVVAVVLIAAIAVLLVLVLRPGTSHHKTAAVEHHHHGVAIAPAPSGVTPSSVTVSVVNATNINQLAHHVSARLTALHFQPGTLATAINESHHKTTVGYLPGHRNDGLAVAHALKLPASAVRPVSQSNEGLVCPNPSDCTADVIVVAGSNLAPKR